VLVTAREDVQLERLMARNGYTREEALARIKAIPLSQAEKARHAHYHIDNSGTLDQTRAYVGFLYENVFEPMLR
jgi:dephospho-CoA kinase